MTQDELLELIDRAAAEEATSFGLTGNGLTEIPEEIAKLTTLTMLCLSFNRLEKMPEAITNLTNLNWLDLCFNEIEHIPEVIFRLDNLSFLSLYNNQIREIPDSIAKLINLQTLVLNYNQIRKIPEDITKLRKLTSLRLSNNKIEQIPIYITKLYNLTDLDLSNNKIKEIPEAIVGLKNLTRLDISGNQITQIPQDILNSKDAKKIFNYILKQSWFIESRDALCSDETIKNKAIFVPDDLTRILNPERYPRDRHNELIELMKDFEFCFALDCNPPQFLIPAILSKEEPADTRVEGESLEFQYHYRVLPNNIMSRFIVLTHDRIHSQTYWRSGVMLQYQENKEIYNIARIKADPEDKKIFIAVSGRKETRRLFLGILRDTFKRIHNTLPNLEITEWVPVPNHPNHPPLDYQELLGLESMGVQEYPIGKLKINIKIRELLDGYESLESRRKSHKADNDLDDRTAYEDMRDIAKLAVSRPIINKAEANAVSENTQFTNNLQGANIANFANEVKDNAQQNATNFNQTSGASIAELLQLITNLRQTAALFPLDVREELIIDVEDVEIEIQKPAPERNIPKLKKRLLALFTAATVTFGAIAGTTDFANNVLEISSKLGIELIKN